MALDMTNLNYRAKVPVSLMQARGFEPYMQHATQRRDQIGEKSTSFCLDNLLDRLGKKIQIVGREMRQGLEGLESLNSGYYPIARQTEEGLDVMLVYPDGKGNIRDVIGPYHL